MRRGREKGNTQFWSPARQTVEGKIHAHRQIFDRIARLEQITEVDLSPNEEPCIPAASTEGHPIATDAETTDAVLVSSEYANPLALESIPYVTIVVVIAGKEEPAREREGDGGDAAEDVVVDVAVKLPVGSNVKETARGIIRASRECIAVRKEPFRYKGV